MVEKVRVLRSESEREERNHLVCERAASLRLARHLDTYLALNETEIEN